MTYLLPIAAPDQYWMATRKSFPDLIDPDIQDGKQRHNDRDSIRWRELAQAVNSIGELLQEGIWTWDEGYTWLNVEKSPEDGFTAPERGIVKAWFSHAEGVKADPRSDSSVFNGRHRLWNTWKHSPDAVLPVRSALLEQFDDLPHLDASFVLPFQDAAARGLDEMPEDVRARSPRFVSSLVKATSISFP